MLQSTDGLISTMTKSASFDVLGTCFHFEPAVEAIHTRLGAKLVTANVDPKTLFFSWFYAAQRDFTYTSIVGSYTPIAEILKHTFKRACQVVDLPADLVTDEDVASIMSEVTKLPPRAELKACYDGLREAGWDVYAVTNGAKQTSLNYYDQAGIDLDSDHLLSCDDIQAAKPDIKVYETANQHLTARGLGQKGDGKRWFVAAHAWDLIAAKKAGFKTAYLSFEEHDPVTQVFGEFDLYAGNMRELLQKLRHV
nr:(s)-2-haloacid dehalogenase [Quercus suber]